MRLLPNTLYFLVIPIGNSTPCGFVKSILLLLVIKWLKILSRIYVELGKFMHRITLLLRFMHMSILRGNWIFKQVHRSFIMGEMVNSYPSS